jgi:bifunctional non-homologous end joining protein LigD
MDARSASKKQLTSTIAGVELSNATRVLYPEGGFTKRDVAAYYEAAAQWIMPHLHDRPLSLVRCPTGTPGECFFQKHPQHTIPEGLRAVEIQETKAVGTYVIADTIAGVIRLVQAGVLELHTWAATEPQLEQPDRVIFDLDPGPGVAWRRIVEAAHLMRALLQELGLASFVKTTGGKGLHVALPLQRGPSWEEVKQFSRLVAEHMAAVLPAQFTARMGKAERDQRIFIDYLRNSRGATAIAAYSTRARPGATISAPLSWDELTENVTPATFNLRSMLTRIQALRADPWAQYWTVQQTLPDVSKRLGVEPAGRG